MRDTTKQPSASAHHVEATKRGIRILKLNPQGLYEEVEVIPASDVLPRLDSGEWDDCPDLGFKIIIALSGHIKKLPDTHALMLWRWSIATAFLREQGEKNGTVIVEWTPDEFIRCPVYMGKHGSMNLHPRAVRLAMANNIEGALIEEYGPEIGTINASAFYMGMRGMDGGLSAMGHDVLNELHDGFVEYLKTEDLPVKPIMH